VFDFHGVEDTREEFCKKRSILEGGRAEAAGYLLLVL